MAAVERPDGAVLDWEEHGNGPTVVLSDLYYNDRSVLAGFVADLARDHRVISYDVRGTGRSSGGGPYSIELDAEDLVALLEATGGAAVAVALGDGTPRAVRVAAARPDLLGEVVVSGAAPLGAETGGEGLSGSASVLSALVRLMESDARSALRSIVESGNPGLDEHDVRRRVDAMARHAPPEVATERMRNWIADSSAEEAAALGGRLWMVHYEGNPWFPPAILDRLREVLPEAHFEEVEDGAINRPELTAAVVRRITGVGG